MKIFLLALIISASSFAQSWVYVGTYEANKGNFRLSYDPSSIKHYGNSLIIDLLYEYDHLNLIDGSLFNQMVASFLIQQEYFLKTKYTLYLNGEFVEEIGLYESDIESEKVEDYFYLYDLFRILGE